MSELHLPVVATVAAGLLGLLYALLSGLVVSQRFGSRVSLGHGEPSADGYADPAAAPLVVAVRTHGNFAEYTPLVLLVIGLVELRTGPTLLVKSLAAGLVLARVMHPLGMRMKAPNPLRAGGFMLTIAVLVVASVTALVVSLG